MYRRFMEVDVFSETAFGGNPLAVVIDSDGLDTNAMQRFANWTNFSETTFLCPPTDPEADYLVRIFTTTMELPFAGHPTLGSCHAWLASGGEPRDGSRIVQQCGVGRVEIHRDGQGRLAFAAPALQRSGPLEPAIRAEVAAALGVAPEGIREAAWIDNGPGWVGVLLGSAQEVLAIRPSYSRLPIGAIGPYAPGSRAAYEVRGFFPDGDRLFEDPVTGSLNASAAQWLIGLGLVRPPYVATQGAALGRSGVVHVSMDATGQVWIGGNVMTCVTGVVEIPAGPEVDLVAAP